MKRVGVFNDIRTCPSKTAFFAMQAAVSTFPGDPVRSDLTRIMNEISATTDQKLQSSAVKYAASLLAQSVPFTEYCLWDYSFVKNVSHKEFASWVDDIQKIVSKPDDKDDVARFAENDTSYFVATLVILSDHQSLRYWLNGYQGNLFPHEFFFRKTIENTWNRLSKNDSNIIPRCTNAMFTVMPSSPDNFYSGETIRSSEWDYLRPVY